MQILFVSFGTLFLGLGILGIILPLVPTTPFLLLAAACYARGSNRFYHWLLNHKWFGNSIRNYRSGSGIPLRGKLTTLLVLWFTIGVTVIFAVTLLWVRIVLVLIALGISVYLLSLPTLRKNPPRPSHKITDRCGQMRNRSAEKP